jgi:hypothetical protein
MPVGSREQVTGAAAGSTKEQRPSPHQQYNSSFGYSIRKIVKFFRLLFNRAVIVCILHTI